VIKALFILIFSLILNYGTASTYEKRFELKGFNGILYLLI